MPMPVRLCQFDLPNGELCRQVAMKDQPVCRHHIRNFREADQDAAREVAMTRLEDRLNQMNLPELLHTLQRKLNRIVRTMPVYDEARTTLRIAIDCLHKHNEDTAALQKFLQTQHSGPEEHNLKLQQLLENRMRPMN